MLQRITRGFCQHGVDKKDEFFAATSFAESLDATVSGRVPVKQPGKRFLAPDDSKVSILSTWFFAILLSAIGLPLFFVALTTQSIIGLLLSTPVAWVAWKLLYDAVRKTMEHAKFGTVSLWLEGEPAVGDTLRAVVDLPGKAAEAGQLDARLVCLRLYWRWVKDKAGRKLELIEREFWEIKREFHIYGNAPRLQVEVHFEIPSDKPHTDLPKGFTGEPTAMSFSKSDIESDRFYYRWELRVTAAMPGVDLQRTFRVPVLPAKVF